MKLNRNFKYRAYPTPQQQALLRGWMGTLRWLWNRFNEQWKMVLSRPKADRMKPSFQWPNSYAQAKEMTELQELPEYEWIQETQRHARAKIITDLEQAWKRCFKKLARTPRSKPFKNTPMRIYAPICAGLRFELNGVSKTRALRLVGAKGWSKLGLLKVIIDRPLQGKVKSWSIIREGAEWYAIACCEIDRPDPKSVNDLAIGIDRGVANLITDSEGRIVPNPRHREKMESRIRFQQKRAGARKKGGKNWRKAYDKANKIRRKAIRAMENLIDTETLFYAENYGTVVIEKLQLVNMTASAKGTIKKPGKNVKQKAGLNRAILSATPGKIGTRLTYKVEERGGKLIETPAPHTSDTCRICQHSDPANRQTQSEFKCTKCGHIEHADIHAAKNILANGLAGKVAVEKPHKKVSRPLRRTKSVAVKPTVKQPEEATCCKGPDESGTRSGDAPHRDLLDRSVQYATFNAEDTS